MNHRQVLSAVSAIALVTCAGLLYAGPLDPPSGPVASTYKTIAEVEPRIAVNSTNTPGAGTSIYRITQPGSYYLTGNLSGGAGRHGIEIAVSGVTLDLNGFDLVGVPGSLDGVSVVSSVYNIAVVNGSVRTWGGDGVDLATAIPINTRVDNVHASGNGGTGILTSSGSTVSNCSASFNIVSGIHTGNGGAVTNSSATGNGAVGISTLGGCSVTNSTAYQNTGNGIQVGVGCNVTDSSSFDNGDNGISTADGSTLVGCSAYGNTGNGISTSTGSTVSTCSAFGNTGSGISTGQGSTVADCTVRINTVDGIVTTNQCVIRNNTCAFNGNAAGNGAGIHTTGNDNRIEGNNCTGADRGIDVDLSGNIIVGNTCSGNSVNWDIAANNYYGAIINRAGVATAFVSADNAPSTLATTDPNANFTY